MIIGLTGNIATGKTTVAKLLRNKGAQVVDADILAHELLEKGQSVYQSIVESFGKGILDAEGNIDRHILGNIIFTDQVKRRKLEALMHPTIIERIETMVALVEKDQVLVIEASLLIETGMTSMVDLLWVTHCSQEEQLRRLMHRAKLTEKEALSRIDAQRSSEEKRALADVVIDTQVERGVLKDKVEMLWQAYVT